MSTFFGFKYWSVARSTHAKRAAVWRLVAKKNGASLSDAQLQDLMSVSDIEYRADLYDESAYFVEAYAAVNSCMAGRGVDVHRVLKEVHGVDVKIAVLRDNSGAITARSIIVGNYYKPVYGPRHFQLEALLIATGFVPFPVVTRKYTHIEVPPTPKFGAQKKLVREPVGWVADKYQRDGYCTHRDQIPENTISCRVEYFKHCEYFWYSQEVSTRRLKYNAKWVPVLPESEGFSVYVD
jgi:hypothetical protein